MQVCRRSRPSAPLLLSLAIAASSVGVAASPAAREHDTSSRAASVQRELPVAKPALDRSGKKRIGTASIYHRRFVGRKMSDGTRMDAHDDNAASKTLPLGTRARVTNLKTRQSATVTIQDRGPYVKGRIVDLSPGTAEEIGIAPKDGLAEVEVKPIELPPPERDAKN